MNNEAEIQGLAHDLANWYWASGRKRQGSYELPASGWLSQLYTLVKSSGAVLDALQQQRPAMAIWGPSQTGKSTLISAYIDGHTELPNDESTAGAGTGLHWPGGNGFYFMAPLVPDSEVDKLPWYLPRKVLNPYNKGMDGSSCLSRFLPGSLDGKPGTVKVAYPLYPAEMKMVTPRDLWHALARGYSTECYGPDRGATTIWDLDKFKNKIRTFIRIHPAQKGPIDRDAYEAMHDFCEVLTDLAESDDPMFRGLGLDSGELASTLRSILEEPAFLQSRDLALEFASGIFWDGFVQLGSFYKTMADAYRSCYGPGGIWENKTVYCSLEATALFLNMGACNISYAPMPNNPKAPEAILKTLISKLGWREQDGDIIVACEDGMPNQMAATPEQFCIYQGLVWELVIPINIANLEDNPFPDAPQRPNALKEYLADADILDFPGVGNETKSMERRIILDETLVAQVMAKASAPGASGQDKERAKRCFTPQLFFKEVLKRGKTASIVSTYAKRLNIDAFSIFQGIRGYACPNADQLINGVKAWWKYATPEYFRNPRGASPLPLNLTLTWWATQLNKAKPNDSNIYGVIEEIVSNLGQIRDPGTCTTFAIHNHKSPDTDFAVIKQDFNPGSAHYNDLMKESAFARQFGNSVSHKSFDEMILDKDTGGAEYFFKEVHRQILTVRQNEKTNRILRLKARLHEMQAEIETLFKQYDIFPNPKPKDTRREKLESFLAALDKLVEKPEYGQMARINLALRHLMNIDYEVLSSVPSSKARVTSDYIASQYQIWITSQCSLCAENGAGAHVNDPDWRVIGVDSPEKMRDILTSLVKSVAPDMNQPVTWLARLVDYSNSGNRDVPDLRRPLAIKLVNIICYGKEGAKISVNPEEDPGAEEIAPEKAAYIYFVEPTIKRMRELAARQIIPIKRPDQEGDDELVALCQHYGINPLKASQA